MVNRKLYLAVVGLLLLDLTLAACDSGSTPAADSGGKSSPGASTAQVAASVQDRASLLAALQQLGVTVSSAGKIEQPFLSVPGEQLKVNGLAVQTFEYADQAALEADAKQIAPNGSISRVMVTWLAQPHFYKAGRLLVIYTGEHALTLALLEGSLGKPFAVGERQPPTQQP